MRMGVKKEAKNANSCLQPLFLLYSKMSQTQTKESDNRFKSSATTTKSISSVHKSTIKLVISILGIYASFLTWAVLQERITATPYGPDKKIFRESLIINTIQSVLASVVSSIYLFFKNKSARKQQKLVLPVFSSKNLVKQYLIIAITQSIASPLGYSSLKHVEYLVFLLGKSCKLLPVMAVQVLFYRRSFPPHKYLVALAVTFGVSLFTIFGHQTKATKNFSGEEEKQALLGVLLLSASLFLDGVYSSTQDNLFRSTPGLTGPHLMCGLNITTSILTSLYLLSPFTSQLSTAVQFISEYPAVLYDIILFGICGAFGQLFIFYTLEHFGSLVLVTVTVTRKMLSMLLSVIWFNHKLGLGQWVGIICVFGGVGSEAYLKYKQQKSKTVPVEPKIKKEE